MKLYFLKIFAYLLLSSCSDSISVRKFGSSDTSLYAYQGITYYNFEESSYNGTAGEILDQIGNNNGVIIGNSISTSDGRTGRGVLLNGSTDGVQIPYIANYDLSSNFTISFDFKPNLAFSSGSPTPQVLLDRGDLTIYLDRFDGRVKVFIPETGGFAENQVYDSAAQQLNTFYEFNGYLYLTSWGGTSSIFVCDPTGGGSASLCDNAADYSISLTPTGQIWDMVEFNGKLYAGTENGGTNAPLYVCDPTLNGDVNICDATDWSVAFTPTTGSGINALINFNGTFYMGTSTAWNGTGTAGDIYICNPSGGGNLTDCDNSADWSMVYDSSLAGVWSLYEFNGTLYAAFGSTGGSADIYYCDPTGGGSTSLCDVNADFNLSLDTTRNSFYGRMIEFNGRLYAGTLDNYLWMCIPETAGITSLCDNVADWTEIYQAPGGIAEMSVHRDTLFLGLSGGGGDLIACNPIGGGDADFCDNTADFAVYLNSSQTEISGIGLYDGQLYIGTCCSGIVYTISNGFEMGSSTTSWASSWYHLALSFDGTTYRLYINGSLENSGISSITPHTSTGPFRIGSSNGNLFNSSGDPEFDGTIDDFVYFDSTLEASNISILANE